jgi:hypothetical protein
MRIPALYVEALWLHARSARKDIFVPLPPTPKRFEAFRLYPQATFLALLRAEAETRPAIDASPHVAVPAD